MVYLFALWLLLLPPLSLAENSVCPSKHNALVVSLQGKLLYSPALRQDSGWQEAKLNGQICENSRIKLDAYSRATLKFSNDIYIKLHPNTILALKDIGTDKPTWLNKFKGFIHVISRTPKRLTIETPIANAGPEGTEFAMSADDDRVSVWVFEGGVRLYNSKGDIKLKPGDSGQALQNEAPQAKIEIKPQDAVNWALYYPPMLPYPVAGEAINADVRTAIKEFRQGHSAAALARMKSLPRLTKDDLVARAAMYLSLGIVDLATQDIDNLLKQNPNDAEALALQSIVELTQNRKEEALALAKKAVAANPKSSPAYSALSYAEQSRFDLDKAFKAAEKAAILAPHDALVWARKAELQLSLGESDDSDDAAQQAIKLDPNLERTQTVLGFAHLNQMDAHEAYNAFEKAVMLDSSSPLARLGLGLTLIRLGDLAAGRQELEIAAMLDPNNSLIRSYLGKAYYEERRGTKADDQFNLAKNYDPNDPTPYFYEALKKQTENKPVEALNDLQKAMDLNDNRAIYRSKQMLDSDRASRGATLARIYDNLGFQQRGVVDAISSLQTDPTNYSAHRFLSDSYVSQPGRETAQLSELLQAKMLQPININPVQPHLSVSQRGLLTASGIANSSFQDFTRVFEGNRPQLLVSGVAGNQGILGDEAVLSGIYNNFSYSLGQFHYQTDGFNRHYGTSEDKNTAQKHNIYDFFVQGRITEWFNAQFEFINRYTKQGNLAQDIIPTTGYNTQNNLDQNIYRFGFNFKLFSTDKLLVSVIHTDQEDQSKSIINTQNPNREINKYSYQTYEAQYLKPSHYYDLTIGFSAYAVKHYTKDNEGNWNPASDNDRNGHRQYAYINLKPNANVTSVLGLSHDYSGFSNNENDKNRSVIYPKFGFQWNFLKGNKLRLAYFRENKRLLESRQTLEPTQIVGFNQFYDDQAYKYFSFYGAGMDFILNSTIYFGFEISRRDVYGLQGEGADLFFQKDTAKSYFNWMFNDHLTLSAQYIFEKKHNPTVNYYSTHLVPVELKYFDGSGVFGKISGTYVNQSLRTDGDQLEKNMTNFFLLDSGIGYRMPNRLGLVNLEVKNIFNKHFRYQDYSAEETSIFYNNSLFVPDRTILGRIIFNF